MKKNGFLIASLFILTLILYACTKGINNNLAESNPREIIHAMGKTIVPLNPQRVVTLTNEATEAALILQVKPVGAVTWYPHLGDQMLDVAPLQNNINIETIRALKPDLIIGSKSLHEEAYQELSSIAPTIYTETISGDIRGNFDLYSSALHKEDFSKQVLVNYNNYIGKAGIALKDLENKKITLVGFIENKAYLFLESSFAGNILSEIGLHLFEHDKQSNSQEFLELSQTDFIDIVKNTELFMYFKDEASALTVETWFNDPIIENLTGTLKHMYPVNIDLFYNANGIIAAKEVIKALEYIHTTMKNNFF